MNQLINASLFLISIVILLPCLIIFIECISALFPEKQKVISKIESRPTLAVLVPAHNEEEDIKNSLNTILPQLNPQDRLVVIADNCTDRTAEVARQYNRAIVIERQNETLRGKGYALDFGLNYLQSDPPEVIVSVDSDCYVGPNTIDIISRKAYQLKRPVQSTYLMEASAQPQPVDLISSFALIVKNLVRPTGLSRLGLPCLLTGSGMAFPWPVIRKVSLANSRTTDDMQTTIDLSLQGYSPIYCPQATVTGRLMEKQAAISQRSRWEHGHIATLFQSVPILLKAAFKERSINVLALALELSVPPVTTLVIAWSAGTIATVLAAIVGFSWTPACILYVGGGLLSVSFLSAWIKFASSYLPFSAFLSIPLYILWKIPVYISFWLRPQIQWNTTERD